MSTMNLWRCPKCSEEVEAMASEVSHRCKANNRTVTRFEVVEKKKK